MSSAAKPIGVVHAGLGQIGLSIARLAAERSAIRSVAALDPSPSVAGRTLAQLCGGAVHAVPVRATLAEALADAGRPGAQVALHAVSSRVAVVEPQLVELVEAGLNVVTTTEELIYPYARSDAAARRIDDAARANGVTVFPTGVNPGILMDRLPAYLTSLCIRTRAVKVRRLVDLGRRREALRRKMGVGRPAAEVQARIAGSSIGHVGLEESLHYLAASLGWKIGPVAERLEPVVATSVVEKAGERVGVGAVLGLSHSAEARDESGRRIALSLVMRLDAAQPFDEIEIDGDPPIRVNFPQGVDGDEATAATVLNATAFAMTAPPGLITRLAVPCGT